MEIDNIVRDLLLTNNKENLQVNKGGPEAVEG